MWQEREKLESVIVTAEEMRQIESRIFAAGMPVAALMEKAATLCANRIQQLYPLEKISTVGILVGPGHNGGDALVIARELYLQGYKIVVYCPFTNLKDLTAQHSQYLQSLGISCFDHLEPLQFCELIIDGLFGFGLRRSLSGHIADAVEKLNLWAKTVVSIDIPSGLHTDTGQVLGIAVKATHSFCLGLWKRAYFQDQALEYLGQAERIDFGIPPQDVWAILSYPPSRQIITKTVVKQVLPLPRPLVTHKYQQGHLLLICGSYRYAGSAILTALGARASGVGMLSVAVAKSLKPILVNHLPEALIIECPETEKGAIASLPDLATNWNKYHTIACGPGLTLEAEKVVKAVLSAPCPLILDADGLNILADLGTVQHLSQRQFSTVITPHLGEFRRLFPDINSLDGDRILMTQQAAQQSGAIVLLKGAKTAIATPQGAVWLVKDSTPALARGGSGDVLTGLIGGLIGQQSASEQLFGSVVAVAAWWHAQAGILAAKEHTELGVDGLTLTQYCNLAKFCV
jgi:NAD(P)H-hydrate epimerase